MTVRHSPKSVLSNEK